MSFLFFLLLKMKLGTLRYMLIRTYDEIAPSDTKPVTDTAIDGDKYSFAVDGIIIHADEVTNKHLLLLDFSLLNKAGEVTLLKGFPYSLRGTRYNDKYIPVKKDTDYPILEKNCSMSIKLTNSDSSNSVYRVAYAVLGYPIISP